MQRRIGNSIQRPVNASAGVIAIDLLGYNSGKEVQRDKAIASCTPPCVAALLKALPLAVSIADSTMLAASCRSESDLHCQHRTSRLQQVTRAAEVSKVYIKSNMLFL